mmetsp:Transcript_23786/g.54217  ORF Transcript_23786/g.54217 Transcript_23786/m.54217 type:complete len:111 (-) Transcript_23786:109-441(-)
MKMLDGQQDLCDPIDRSFFRYCSVFCFVCDCSDSGRQTPTLREVHEKGEITIRSAQGRVHADNVRMIRGCQNKLFTNCVYMQVVTFVSTIAKHFQCVSLLRKAVHNKVYS